LFFAQVKAPVSVSTVKESNRYALPPEKKAN